GTAPLAAWVGQGADDRTGVGPAVGPDGLQDARIALTNLPAKLGIRSVGLEAPGGSRWESGPNPKGDRNAEFVRDPGDPSKADLYFQPDGDLGGRSLTLAVSYADGKRDALAIAAGRTDPRRPVARASVPTLVAHSIA